MNDASGERIDSHAAAIASRPQLPKEDKTTDGDGAHEDHSQWFFASSIFPMVAGTLGPVASAFSICALVRPWRQSYPPGTSIQTAPFIDDPRWLVIINAVQLAVAIIANLALLCNMARRLRFTIAQPITIVGWYISAFSLVGLTATGAGPLEIEPKDQFVWSQAFYYALYSALIYFLVASLMVVTSWGASAGHYPTDFALTASQRTLMLQSIMFLMYLLIGALVYSNIEGWEYLDSVYWADVTIFTVGFGDFSPQTTLGRALLFPYALIGIITLGLVIGSIRTFVLERGRKRLDARIMERNRQRIIRKLVQNGKDHILIPVQDRPDGVSTELTEAGWTELDRREAEFKLMRKIQTRAATRRRWLAMSVSTSTWTALWLVGAKIFQECELPYQGWSYFDAMYLAFESLTTIGYGDMVPISNAGKSFFVLWSLMALPATTIVISNAGDTVVKGIRDLTNDLSNVAVLSGERGLKKKIKTFIHSLTCEVLFEGDDEVEESPPGLLGQAHHVDDPDSDPEDPGQERRNIDSEKNERGREKAQGAANKENSSQSSEDGSETNEKKPRNGTITFSDSTKAPPGPAADTNRLSNRSRPASQSRRSSREYPSSQSPSSPSRSVAATSASSPEMSPMSRAVSVPRHMLPEIPTNKADYHVMLIEEIGNVTQHLKNHPPRKYSYQEWAWYLKLIGEDESNADLHREPQPFKNGHHDDEDGDGRGKSARDSRRGSQDPGHGVGNDADGSGRRKPADSNNGAQGSESDWAAQDPGHGHDKWSWIGTRSPLMGTQEEAEYILAKLMQKLTEELHEESELQRRDANNSDDGGDGVQSSNQNT